MILDSLAVRGFRSLCEQELRFSPGLTILVGLNGAGKSNLLEAVTVAGNLVSFRPGTAAHLVRWGERGYSLQANVIRSGSEVSIRQEAGLGHHVTRSLWRGARRLTMGEYLQICPVAALSSHDRALIVGVPEDRRRFLDRLVFHLHVEALSLHQQYRRALRQRAELLARNRPESEVEAFEQVLATTGVRLVAFRLEALQRLAQRLETEMEVLSLSAARTQLRYHAPDGLGSSDAAHLAARMKAALARSRRIDVQQRRTTVGPHRHDLAITVGGIPAREALSAGQAKLLAVALRLAVLAVVQERLGSSPVVVFDDVDAELDGEALGRVLARLDGRAQVLISSARPELVLPAAKQAAVWRVVGGKVAVAQQEGSQP